MARTVPAERLHLGLACTESNGFVSMGSPQWVFSCWLLASKTDSGFENWEAPIRVETLAAVLGCFTCLFKGVLSPDFFCRLRFNVKEAMAGPWPAGRMAGQKAQRPKGR